MLAAAARARRRDDQANALSALVGEVFTGAVGMARRPLPDHIERMLDELETARRGDEAVPAAEPAPVAA